MKRNASTICLLLMSLLVMTSCDDNVDIYNKTIDVNFVSHRSDGKIFTPEEVVVTDTLHSLEDRSFYNLQRTPSLGNVNILVLPILIPDYQTIDLDNDGNSDNDLVLSDINLAFFGQNDDERLLNNSLATFYEESSYGKLHLSGTVAPWYDASESGYLNAAEITSESTLFILEDAIDNYFATSGDTKNKYDSDQDGYFDAIWMIYSAPNYQNGGPMLDDMNYWAYTSWANQDAAGDRNNLVANTFGWASYDFMYNSFGVDKVDAHTYIHEMGHFFGLNDYYSNDSLSYAPTGRIDMMDGNVIDHNSYSKILLGWTKPYLVYGSGTINLKSMQNENACIVLLSDEAEVSSSFNPFSEYLLIDYYTNEGLNEFVSINKYELLKAPSSDGLRLYHIDKRLYKVNDSLTGELVSLYQGEDDVGLGLISPLTNNRDYDIYNYNFGFSIALNLFDEIRLIENGGLDTFSYGGIMNDKTLFKSRDKFSIDNYPSYFLNNLLNNGEDLSTTIEVL